MQSAPDPYRVLGVGRDATREQIRAAHRRLAKRHHPDASGGDTSRFLAIQAAYQVLSDPLARRDWDRRHSPSPIRADEGVRRGAPGPGERYEARRTGRRADGAGRGAPGPSPVNAAAAGGAAAGRDGAPARGSARGRGAGTAPRGAAGAGSPADGDARRPRPDARSASGRDPAADRYTWSAENVPWWEDGGQPYARRRPGRARPPEAQGAGASERSTTSGRPGGRTGSAGPAGGSAGRGERPAGRTAGTVAPGGVPRASGPGAPAEPPADFDVYSRSSGAAWSMAARAYFRRPDADLPRGASDPYAHRWTTPAGGPARRRTPADAAAAPAATGRPGPASAAEDRPRPFSTAGPAESSRTRPDAAPAPGPGSRREGVVYGDRGLSAASARARERNPGASTTDRLAHGLLGWLGIVAGLVALGVFGGGETAPATWPLPPLALAIMLPLALARPRAAYDAGWGALAAGVAWRLALAPPAFRLAIALAAFVIAAAAADRHGLLGAPPHARQRRPPSSARSQP